MTAHSSTLGRLRLDGFTDGTDVEISNPQSWERCFKWVEIFLVDVE